MKRNKSEYILYVSVVCFVLALICLCFGFTDGAMIFLLSGIIVSGVSRIWSHTEDTEEVDLDQLQKMIDEKKKEIKKN